jgi:hypothetical protein
VWEFGELIAEDAFDPACEIGEFCGSVGVARFGEFSEQLGEQCGGVDVLMQQAETLSQLQQSREAFLNDVIRITLG